MAQRRSQLNRIFSKVAAREQKADERTVEAHKAGHYLRIESISQDVALLTCTCGLSLSTDDPIKAFSGPCV